MVFFSYPYVSTLIIATKKSIFLKKKSINKPCFVVKRHVHRGRWRRKHVHLLHVKPWSELLSARSLHFELSPVEGSKY